jgi:hypothetical protein
MVVPLDAVAPVLRISAAFQRALAALQPLLGGRVRGHRAPLAPLLRARQVVVEKLGLSFPRRAFCLRGVHYLEGAGVLHLLAMHRASSTSQEEITSFAGHGTVLVPIVVP